MRPSVSSAPHLSGFRAAWPLGVVLLLGLMWSWPLLDGRFLPLHNTLFLVESFHIIYSHVLEHHTFPYWIPTMEYGVPSTLHFFGSMEPSRVVMTGIGLLLGIRDTLLLVKISFLLDQALLTIGVWQLCRELFRQPWAIVLTTLAASFIGQPWLMLQQVNLGVVYTLPWALFFTMRGCRRHQIGYLLAALAVIPFAYYFMGLQLLILWVVFLFARRNFAWSWKDMRPTTRGQWAGVALLLAWASVWVGYFGHMVKTFDVLHGQEGRWGPFVPLGEFLTFSLEMIRLPRWIHLLGGAMDFTRVPVSGYPGWLPLMALGYAVWKVRSRLFLGFALAALITLGISSGGVIAALSYFFPGQQFARHLGHIGGFIQLLLVLAGGFGFERLFRALHLTRERGGAWVLFRSRLTRVEGLMLAALVVYGLDAVGTYMVYTDILPTLEEARGARWEWLWSYGVRIALYAALGAWLWRWRRIPARAYRPWALGIPLFAVLSLELGLFHTLERHMMPALDAPARKVISGVFTAGPQPFVPERSVITPEMAETQKYFGVSVLDGGPLRTQEDVRQAIHHAALGLEGCQHAWDALVMSKNIRILLEALVSGIGESPDLDLSFNVLPRPYKKRIGCEQPKLRLLGFAQGRVVQTPVEALTTFMGSQEADTVVLRGPQQSRLAPLAGDPALRALLPSPPADALTAQLQVYQDDRFLERRIVPPFTLDLTFKAPFTARSYALKSGPHGADSRDRMPIFWQVLGSNDGQEWTLLSQVRDAPAWDNRRARYYAMSVPQPFARYRLVVDRLASGDVLRLHQLFLSPLPLGSFPPEPASAGARPAPGTMEPPLRYTANLLEVPVTVADPQGAWLVYADAFNPYWKARLDGHPADLMEADLGFKAVFVPPGGHRVTFHYDDPVARWLYWSFALFPFLFPLALLPLRQSGPGRNEPGGVSAP